MLITSTSLFSIPLKGNEISCLWKGKSPFKKVYKWQTWPMRHLCFYSLEVVFIPPGLTEHPAPFPSDWADWEHFFNVPPLYPPELMKEGAGGAFTGLLHSACWLDVVNCMSICDGKTRAACINPPPHVNAFALWRSRCPWMLLYALRPCVFPHFSSLTCFKQCLLISPARTVAYFSQIQKVRLLF